MHSESPDLLETAEALRTGKVSSRDLLEQVLTVADRYDDALGVFVSRFDTQARAAADAADQALRQGRTFGPLHGIPIGVKDIVTTNEGTTTAQSRAMDPAWGSGDAEVVARLREAGAIIVGKTSTLEFASFVPDPDAPFTIPANPWDASRWPGGSSSGSGAGVAAGMMWGAVGTDTGGSIRVPASFCGISGLKPTTGMIPTAGCLPIAYSADVIGPMARSARDCAVLFEVMSGQPLQGTVDVSGLRIGVVTLADQHDPQADPTVDELFHDAMRTFEGLGARLTSIELPLYSELLNALYLTFEAERLTWHRSQLAERWRDYGGPAREGLARGIHYSAADYVQAQRVRRRGQQLVTDLFDDVDLVISPTCSRTSPSLTQITECMRTWKQLVHAPYWSALGNPAMSVPMGLGADGLPIGLQIIGQPFSDGLVLQAAEAYQDLTSWHRQSPDLRRIQTTAPQHRNDGKFVSGLQPDVDEPQHRTFVTQLLSRHGITEPSPGDMDAAIAHMRSSQAAVASLYAVDCGEDGSAVELTFPEPELHH